jgi:hypothetical protein
VSYRFSAALLGSATGVVLGGSHLLVHQLGAIFSRIFTDCLFKPENGNKFPSSTTIRSVKGSAYSRRNPGVAKRPQCVIPRQFHVGVNNIPPVSDPPPLLHKATFSHQVKSSSCRSCLFRVSPQLCTRRVRSFFWSNCAENSLLPVTKSSRFWFDFDAHLERDQICGDL